MLHLPRQTLSIAQNLGLTQNQLKELQNIITAMHAYVDGHVNQTVQRRSFRCRNKRKTFTTIYFPALQSIYNHVYYLDEQLY